MNSVYHRRSARASIATVFANAFVNALFKALALAVGVGGLLWGCATSEEKPIETHEAYVKPFEIPKEYASRKYDIRRTDFNGDGKDDAILMLYRADTTSPASKLARGFEALELYEYDSTKKSYSLAFKQKYYYGTTVDVRDLDRDGIMELCVKTDGGGNSPLASQGLSIVARTATSANKTQHYHEQFVMDEGAPELVMTKDSSFAVVSYISFAPPFASEADAINLVDSIVVYGTATQRESVRQALLNEYLLAAADKYRQAKTTLSLQKNDASAAATVYTNAAAQLVYLYKLGRAKDAAALRQREAPYWQQALPTEARRTLEDLASGGKADEILRIDKNSH